MILALDQGLMEGIILVFLGDDGIRLFCWLIPVLLVVLMIGVEGLVFIELHSLSITKVDVAFH